MKLKSIYLSAFALLGLLSGASCSDEATREPEITNPGEPDGAYYIMLNVQAPNQAGTRNTTNENGTSGQELPGTAAENALNQATIYFAVNNIVKFSFESDYIEAYQAGNYTPQKTHWIRIKIDDNISQFADLVGEEKVQMFIVGNTTDGNTELYTPTGVGINDDLTDATFSIASADADVAGDFGTAGHTMPLMNAEEYTLDFSAETLNITLTTATTNKEKVAAVVKKYFKRDTGTILWWDMVDVLKLERGVARLEFKDITRTSTPETSGSKRATSNASLPAYCYQIGESGVIVKIHALTPFNLNKESYLFRHTAEGDNREANTAAKLFGKERGTDNSKYNWVAGSDWSFSTNSFTKTPTFSNALSLSNLSDAQDDWAYVVGTSNGDDDLTRLVSVIETRSNGSDGYHPWCYVPENTLPSVDLFEHHKEVPKEPATGTPGDDDDENTVATDTETETVPVITNNATGVVFKVQVMNEDGSAPLRYNAEGQGYPDEITNSETPNNIIITMDDGKWVELAPEGGFYYMKYIACIIHNEKTATDNGFVPMQYGVVRNNTYQITVADIPYLPLPRDPKTLWVSLQVNVLPWTVRKNDIDF